MNELRQNIAAPWYRHRWPWILMAGPAVVIVAGFITAWLAIISYDGLVEDNYYKVGLAVNQQLKQKQLAADLNLGADLSLSSREARFALCCRAYRRLPGRKRYNSSSFTPRAKARINRCCSSAKAGSTLVS